MSNNKVLKAGPAEEIAERRLRLVQTQPNCATCRHPYGYHDERYEKCYRVIEEGDSCCKCKKFVEMAEGIATRRTCTHCDFGSGRRGMDRCAKCDGNGWVPVGPASPVVEPEHGFKKCRHCGKNIYISSGHGGSWTHIGGFIECNCRAGRRAEPEKEVPHEASQPTPVVVPEVELCLREDCDSNHICFNKKFHDGPCYVAPVVVSAEPKKSKLDDISLRSLRALCEQQMQRHGDYVQVSIFAKTILTLLDENAEFLSTHPAPLPSDDKWIKCPQCNRENSADIWAKFGNKCPNCGDLFAKESAALPVGEKESFEDWWTKKYRLVNDTTNPFHRSLKEVALSAWNAAKAGEKEEK